jgi:hypothetical protein
MRMKSKLISKMSDQAIDDPAPSKRQFPIGFKGDENVTGRLALLFGLVMFCLAFTFQAMAGTTVSVSLTFTEPVMNKDCPLNVGGGPGQGFCGSGEVIPLGHATETIEFGAGCGGTCDLRTINLPEGSIFIEEVFSNLSCRSGCEFHGENMPPGSGTLTDVIIGGTGIFEGATGTLNGMVRFAGKTSQIKFSGTIVLSSGEWLEGQLFLDEVARKHEEMAASVSTGAGRQQRFKPLPSL